MALISKKGFTMVELLIVVLIIGLITAAGVGSYLNVIKRSRDQKRRADLVQFQTALELYKADQTNRIYPGITQDIQLYRSTLLGQFISQYPNDPFQNSGWFYNYVNLGGGTDYMLCTHLETGGNGTCTSYQCGPSIQCNYSVTNLK